MSILHLSHRPIIRFDVNNAEHRQTYFEFKKNRGWGKSKYRFVIDNSASNLVDYCDREIVEYYLDKEFGEKAD